MLQCDRLETRSQTAGQDAEEDMLLPSQFGQEVKVEKQEEDRSEL